MTQKRKTIINISCDYCGRSEQKETGEAMLPDFSWISIQRHKKHVPEEEHVCSEECFMNFAARIYQDA